jgi:hypothetical protein
MALIFTLLGIALLSMLAASLMFVSSAGSFASLNFKNQMQATYAAVSGEQVALNWFQNTYAPWLNSVASPSYDTSGTQPTYSGNPVVLASTSGASNFPNSGMVSSFGGIATGSVAMGNVSTSYTMTATLLKRDIGVGMDGSQVETERWQVDVTGTVAGALGNAAVEERALIERFFIPLFKDAIRGQCVVDLRGDINTDSYFSTNGPYGGSNRYTGASAQASVGSNTFIQAVGNAGTINGNAYYGTAVPGQCTCPVTPCESFNHPDIVAGDIIQAPGVGFPVLPTFDSSNAGTDDCPLSGKGSNKFAYVTPSNSGTPPTIPTGATGHYHTCNPNGQATVYFCVGDPTVGGVDNTANFFFNYINIGAQATIQIMHLDGDGNCTSASPACSTSTLCAPVRLYVNQGLSLGGGGAVGIVPGDPNKLSVMYSGTALTSYDGTSDFVGTIYAPNAELRLRGGAIIYGAVSAKNVSDAGNVSVHYDLSLQAKKGMATAFRLINQTRRVF